jgi:hypothetical protein
VLHGEQIGSLKRGWHVQSPCGREARVTGGKLCGGREVWKSQTTSTHRPGDRDETLDLVLNLEGRGRRRVGEG